MVRNFFQRNFLPYPSKAPELTAWTPPCPLRSASFLGSTAFRLGIAQHSASGPEKAPLEIPISTAINYDSRHDPGSSQNCLMGIGPVFLPPCCGAFAGALNILAGLCGLPRPAPAFPIISSPAASQAALASPLIGFFSVPVPDVPAGGTA